jgi:hypothetical protein
MQLARQNPFFFLLAATAVVFALCLFNPFNFYFLNDDLIHIPLSKEGVLFQRRSFRPIGDMSVQLDYLLWGKKAWGYHLTNLLLHTANTVLVYFFSLVLINRYKGNNNSVIQSLMVSLLFFVYAFHSESIFWILGRSGSLATLFFIPALLAYLKRHESFGYFILSLVFFELGLLAYESVWVFPLMAVLISLGDKRFFKTNLRQEIIFTGWIIAVFIIHLVTRQQVIGEVVGAYEAAGFMRFDFQKLGSNFFKLFGRSFLPPVNNNSTLLILFFFLVAVMIAAFAFLRNKKAGDKPRTFFLLIIVTFMVLSILPYVSLGIDTHGVEGERYLYMPSIFFCMVSVNLVFAVTQNKAFQLALYAALVCFHLIFIARSASYYRTSSNISRTTFLEMNALEGKRRLFIDSLPQAYNGALIFRLGFDEGAKWLKENGSVDSIIVLSLKKNNQAWSPDYKVDQQQTFELGPISYILLRDTTQQQTYISKEVAPLVFNPQTDAWFIFKDDRLQVIK